MPYQLDWYIQGRIIYRRFSGIVTEEELQSYYEQLSDLLQTGNAPIHIINHDSQLERIPIRPSLNRKNRQILSHPSFGWSITIGQLHPIIRLPTIFPRKVFRTQWQWFRKWEEAKKFLKKNDPTLNWQTANEALITEN